MLENETMSMRAAENTGNIMISTTNKENIQSN